jgi:polysaccharide biosynthesis/export protein
MRIPLPSRLLVAVLLWTSPMLVDAATMAGPTPEQLQLLKQLPPAQRELLRKALKDDGAGVKSTPEDTAETEKDDKNAGPFAETEKQKEERFERPIRLQAGDTVLLTFKPIEKPAGDSKRDDQRETALTQEEKTTQRDQRLEQQRLRQALLPSEPVFVLDQFGALAINNVGRFVLAGLNEAEAGERLEAEAVFNGLRVRVKRLPIEPEIKRFGHDLFIGPPKTFAPAGDVPVSADYVIGPGDTVIVQLVGKENVEHDLVVTRDGTLLFPGLGPIAVAGMKFSQLQKELSNRVARQFIGTRASVTLGRLRSIRVFVLGDVARPGSYTVSGLATLTNAIFASGGVTPAGSLRDIQLKRGGEIVGRLDLYDLLLRGDTRGDARLLPGDVIFVPPLRVLAGVSGRVRRPAFYELKDEKSVEELISMAGGLLPDAYPTATRLDRVGENGARAVLSLDVTKPEGQGMQLRDGDIVRVFAVPERAAQSVTLSGWVQHAGSYQWRPGMRLTDLISSLAVFRPQADIHFVLIQRERANDRHLELIGADPLSALQKPQGPSDVALMPNDDVRVFGVQEDRSVLLKPLLERARLTASPADPVREVVVEGAVHHPGRYPWSAGMTVQDLIHAGGGMTERAYTVEAELTRFVVTDGKSRAQTRQLVQLRSNGEHGEAATRLQPYDQLVIRRTPQWDEEGTVEILGEVRFPGRYPIARGERLSKVLQRAGGLSEVAYPRASVFLRESVRQREQEYLERLTAQLERDLFVFRTEGPEVGVRKDTALLEGEALLRQMRASKASGRMVIKLDAIVSGRDDYDVVMQPGDKLVIPSRPDEVTVVGEVYYPTSHVYAKDRGRDDYVRLSGGVTERGNKRAVYVVHADGSVTPPPGWFGGDAEAGPGDTVIVPVKVDRIGNLKLFTDISTILYQLAVTAAALHSIGVF